MPPPPEGPIWLPGWAAKATFQQTLAAAVAELSRTGFVSPDRLNFWLNELRTAGERELGPEADIDALLRHSLGSTFRKLVDQGRVIKHVPEVSRFTLTSVRPQLRAELDRRIFAAADLIKLHRREAVSDTLRRFQGWATSIPVGGDETVDRREVKASVGKNLAQFKWERRRVQIDQGNKLIANVAEIIATDSGAIAGEWHDHGEHDKRYHARKEHLARSGKIYLVRDSWAHREGLVRPVHGFMDEVERPGQLPFCGCWYRWIQSPRRLPDDFLTKKGQDWIAAGREALERMRAA